MTTPLQLPPVLEPLRNTIESVLAPCILLVPDKNAPVLTHLDGKPRLAPGSTWPEGPDGPLAFVGQIDFAEAAGAGGVELGLPDRGLLAMFCDEDFWTGESPDDRRRFHVAYTLDTARTVELEPPEELYAKNALPHVFRSGVSLPDFFDRALENYESLQSGKRLDAYSDLCEDFVEAQHGGKCEGDHRLRGHAAWGEQDGRLTAQLASNGVDASHRDDPRRKAMAPGAAAWNLLWQVDKSGLPSSTDIGAFHLVIRDEDLAACAFERAWVVNLIA